MVSVEEIEAKVKEIAARRFKKAPDEITPETRLREDLGADSLDLLELVYEFEETFDVPIPDDGTVEIRTIGDAIRYVTER